MTDLWNCGNCYFIGPLNEHGRCARCQSEAVVPQAILPDEQPAPVEVS